MYFHKYHNDRVSRQNELTDDFVEEVYLQMPCDKFDIDRASLLHESSGGIGVQKVMQTVYCNVYI